MLVPSSRDGLLRLEDLSYLDEGVKFGSMSGFAHMQPAQDFVCSAGLLTHC